MVIYMQQLPDEQQQQDEWLTSDEVVQITGLKYNRIHYLARDGRLTTRPSKLDKRRILFSRKSVERLMQDE